MAQADLEPGIHLPQQRAAQQSRTLGERIALRAGRQGRSIRA